MSETLRLEKISSDSIPYQAPTLFETPDSWSYDLSKGDQDFLFPDANLNPGRSDIMYILMYFDNVAVSNTSTVALIRTVDPSATSGRYVEVPASEQTLDIAAQLSVDWNYDAMGWTRTGIRYTQKAGTTGTLTKIFIAFKNRK